MFIIFTLIYTALIFLTSFFIETTVSTGGAGFTGYFILIFFLVSLGLSLLYAWLIVKRNSRTWAILKCIGYTNGNINMLVSGIIFFTMIIGFIIVIEVLFHYTAIFAYLQSANIVINLPAILITLIPVIISFVIFLLVQILAIILANRRILKVRPIIALKKPGE